MSTLPGLINSLSVRKGSAVKEVRAVYIRSRSSATLQWYPKMTSCDQAPYRARATPSTPTAPAKLRATPVGAAPPSEVEEPADPEGEPEAEPDAEPEAEPDDEASEPVGEADEEVVVSTVVDAVVVETPLEDPVALAREELMLPLTLVASAETEEAQVG